MGLIIYMIEDRLTSIPTGINFVFTAIFMKCIYNFVSLTVQVQK